MNKKIQSLILTAFFTILTASAISAQSTAFTYQGRLLDNGLPPTALYDFEFSLWNSLVAGTQAGGTLQILGIQVTNGIFTVRLDFGAQFTGAVRFLQIGVKNVPGPFTVLAPRQALSSAPYAVRSLNSTTADTATTANNALNLGGVAANQFVVTTDPRMTDERPPTAGSTSYIQNNTSQQATSNFNVSGDGTAGGTLSGNIVSATAQYNIGANRVFSIAGSNNTFAGVNAGAITTAANNSFFGRSAGGSNTTGFSNAFFGAGAGFFNTTGSINAFFGKDAGLSNTTGISNAFFGADAGALNTIANNNAFFGKNAGRLNTIGADNAFFGTGSGSSNTTGAANAFFGQSAGQENTTGNDNAFFGGNAGASNTTGSNNTIIGRTANVGSGGLSFATAIGAGAVASQSNSIYLGRPAGEDTVRIPGAVIIEGSLVVDTLGGTTGNVHLCRNTANRLSLCTTNFAEKGETEALKLRISGQQTTIDNQQKTIEQQQKQIDALKAVVCSQNATAAICRPKE